MFAWEQEFDTLSDDQRLITLNNIEAWRELARYKTVSHLLTLPIPSWFRTITPDHEPVNNIFGSWEGFMIMCELRSLQWRKYYRGPVRGILAKFRSDLNLAEDRYLEENLDVLRRNL